ncbi:hypothetical protein PsorP6_004857 [Peronosclerospora sorghi]|uniref:Uncharacterized protein n=1 Tax=Peronosclerospora sorghi TaxID=230839 RepID=A0ACC0W675_9STRA|nr:hypothetical protein PsorP6_004857 [Peronosclerospora sorghi]
MGAIHYAPETRSHLNKNFATCGEYPMSLGTCIQTVIELKEKTDGDESNLPIVIHFENAH